MGWDWKNAAGIAATAINPIGGGAAWYFSDKGRREAFDKRNPADQLRDWISGGRDSRAEREREEVKRLYDEMQSPDIQDIAFEELGPSGYEDIKADPRLRQAQMMAIQQMIDRVDAGGLTDVDKARIQDTLNKFGTANRGAQEAIIADAQRRGVAGSGLELMSRMQGSQDAATRANTEGLQTAALAQQARERALDQLMSGSSSVRGQDYSEAARKADAQDRISQFNTNIRNQGQYMNRVTLPQQRFGNDLQLTDRRAGARGSMADFQKQLGDATTATTGQVLNAAGQVVGAIAGGAGGGAGGAAAGGMGGGGNGDYRNRHGWGH